MAGSWKTEPELNAKAEKLRAELQLDALLVTRSEDGMSLYRANEVLHEPGRKTREVFDVSGAGDTVIATMAVMLASGANFSEAMCVATVQPESWWANWARRSSVRAEIIQDMNG